MMKRDPKKKKGEKFTEEEDELLKELVEKYGKDWIRISDEMGLNNPVKVKNRHYNLVKKRATADSNEDLKKEQSL